MTKKVRVLRSRLAPRGYVMNMFGVLLTRNKEMITPALINHELIHTAQMRELVYIPFYLIYIFEWLWRLITTRNFYRAYRTISFEREAYAHGHDRQYLRRRKRWAQWRRESTD